jgi:hypothetical protein
VTALLVAEDLLVAEETNFAVYTEMPALVLTELKRL